MKKNLLKLLFLAFVGIAICYSTYNSEKEVGLSDLTLSNIEALAQGESGTSGTCGSTAWTGDSYFTVCNVSKAEAMENYNWWDTPYKWWCCDSCSSTSYCG